MQTYDSEQDTVASLVIDLCPYFWDFQLRGYYT